MACDIGSFPTRFEELIRQNNYSNSKNSMPFSWTSSWFVGWSSYLSTNLPVISGIEQAFRLGILLELLFIMTCLPREERVWLSWVPFLLHRSLLSWNHTTGTNRKTFSNSYGPSCVWPETQRIVCWLWTTPPTTVIRTTCRSSRVPAWASCSSLLAARSWTRSSIAGRTSRRESRTDASNILNMTSGYWWMRWCASIRPTLLAIELLTKSSRKSSGPLRDFWCDQLLVISYLFKMAGPDLSSLFNYWSLLFFCLLFFIF